MTATAARRTSGNRYVFCFPSRTEVESDRSRAGIGMFLNPYGNQAFGGAILTLAVLRPCGNTVVEFDFRRHTSDVDALFLAQVGLKSFRS